MGIPSFSQNTAIHTVLGTIVVFLITTLGSFVYSTHAAIMVLSKEISQLHKEVDKILLATKLFEQDQRAISVLQANMKSLAERTLPFIQYGNRFSREDFKMGKQEIYLYIDKKFAINQESCHEILRQYKESKSK